jgi:hypothetical protein
VVSSRWKSVAVRDIKKRKKTLFGICSGSRWFFGGHGVVCKVFRPFLLSVVSPVVVSHVCRVMVEVVAGSW